MTIDKDSNAFQEFSAELKQKLNSRLYDKITAARQEVAGQMVGEGKLEEAVKVNWAFDKKKNMINIKHSLENYMGDVKDELWDWVENQSILTIDNIKYNEKKKEITISVNPDDPMDKNEVKKLIKDFQYNFPE